MNQIPVPDVFGAPEVVQYADKESVLNLYLAVQAVNMALVPVLIQVCIHEVQNEIEVHSVL